MVWGCRRAPVPGWGSRTPRSSSSLPPSRLLSSPGWPTQKVLVAKPRVSLARDAQRQVPCSHKMLRVRRVSEASPKPSVSSRSPIARSATVGHHLTKHLPKRIKSSRG